MNVKELGKAFCKQAKFGAVSGIISDARNGVFFRFSFCGIAGK